MGNVAAEVTVRGVRQAVKAKQSLRMALNCQPVS